jgi:hypothetical protein
MDSQVHPAAKEVQEAQNLAVLALMKSLAELIGQLKNLQLTPDDLILMSGSKQAWPKNNANIDLVAKINDIFLNTENKASVRIFIEDANGKRTQIFRQVKGVIPPKGDPFNFAESMRALLTQQNLATFAKEPPQPKVVIETDPSVAVNSSNIVLDPEVRSQITREQGVSATSLSDERLTESIPELQAEHSPLVEGNIPETSARGAAVDGAAENPRIDAATAIPLTDEQIAQTIAELQLKHKPATGVEIPENLGLALANGLTPEQAIGMGDPKLKFSYIQADGLRLQLNEYYRRSNLPGYEYIKTDPKMKDEVKLDELESSFALAVATVEQRLTALQREGRWMPANQSSMSVPADKPTLVRDYTPDSLTVESIMDQSAPLVQEQNEAFILNSISNRIPFSEQSSLALVEDEQSIVSFNDPIHALHEKVSAGGLSVIERSDLMQIDPHNQYAALATLQRIETPDLDRRMIDYGIATIAHDAGLQMPEIQKMLTARDELVNVDSDFYKHTVDVLSTVDPIWIPESPYNEQVNTLAADQANMLSGSDEHSRAVQSFVSEVSALSNQIESIRAEANATQSAVKTFAQDMQQRVNEPAIKAWASTQISEVAAQSVSIRDRLKSAGAGLVETLKQRAGNDWQVVKEVVVAKTAEGWERHGGAISTAWVDVQRSAIGSHKIDRAIETVIDHLGDRQGASGMASLDGYRFAVHNGQTAIFNSKNEPIYKDGLLTGKQTTSDTAYLVALPDHVEQAAKASEALQASHQTAPSQQASAPARKR